MKKLRLTTHDRIDPTRPDPIRPDPTRLDPCKQRPATPTTTVPRDDALRLGRQHDEALRVVGAAGHDDVDALLLVQLQFVIKNLLVESVLQAFISEVDQQLLELVLRVKVLEACRRDGEGAARGGSGGRRGKRAEGGAGKDSRLGTITLY